MFFKNPSSPMIFHLLHNSTETKNLVLIISLSKGKLILQNMAQACIFIQNELDFDLTLAGYNSSCKEMNKEGFYLMGNSEVV
jgi:hypothetical protein